jgi:hypothetical protein
MQAYHCESHDKWVAYDINDDDYFYGIEQKNSDKKQDT